MEVIRSRHFEADGINTGIRRVLVHREHAILVRGQRDTGTLLLPLPGCVNFCGDQRLESTHVFAGPAQHIAPVPSSALELRRSRSGGVHDGRLWWRVAR